MHPSFLIIIYVISFTVSNLCFKKTGMVPVQSLSWWIWFGAGNISGFLCPVAISAALRGGSAPWIFAMAIGVGFLALQLCLWMMDREAVSHLQMLGIFLIGLGLILVNTAKAP